MGLTAENLVGYLRAEFAKSGQLRIVLFFVQLAVALPAAFSVLVPDDHKLTLYVLGIIGAALLFLWWLLNERYLSARLAAQAARRAVLLVGGLGNSLSPNEILNLRERFTVTEEAARAAEKFDYYATKLPPGSARLGEMIEESALHSEYLQRVSANVMLGVLVLFVAIFVVIALAITPFVDRDTIYIVIRAFLAMLVFVMSADVLGAYRLHRVAAKQIKNVRNRLSVADSRSYPLPDVLFALADYNAAVEIAPESVPFAYQWYAEELNARWNTYQNDRAHARASR